MGPSQVKEASKPLKHLDAPTRPVRRRVSEPLFLQASYRGGRENLSCVPGAHCIRHCCCANCVVESMAVRPVFSWALATDNWH